MHVETQEARIPPWGPGGLSRECAPPYPQRDRKRRLNGAVCRNHRIKGWSRVGAWTGTLKNPAKCLWRWEPDRRSNFFFSPPAHLCAVTCITEISLIVTLNNQLHTYLQKPASQFILYVPVDPIGPNLVSLIRNSEFHLQPNFWSEAPYSSHCNGCQNLRKMQNIAFCLLQKASDIQYESTKPASKRTNIIVYKRNIKRDSSHLLPKKFHLRLKTPLRRFQHHSAVIKWFKIRYFHKLKFHRIWTCWTNSRSLTVSGYPDCQE